MSQENKGVLDEWKNKSFLKRYKVVLVGVSGLLILHVAWDRLVDTYVPENERSKISAFKYLKKLDPFPRN